MINNGNMKIIKELVLKFNDCKKPLKLTYQNIDKKPNCIILIVSNLHITYLSSMNNIKTNATTLRRFYSTLHFTSVLLEVYRRKKSIKTALHTADAYISVA